MLDLEGHSAPIVAVLFLGRSKAEDSQAVKAEEVVVTGSSDGIKVWSLLALQCGGEERTAIQPRIQMDGPVTVSSGGSVGNVVVVWRFGAGRTTLHSECLLLLCSAWRRRVRACFVLVGNLFACGTARRLSCYAS